MLVKTQSIRSSCGSYYFIEFRTRQRSASTGLATATNPLPVESRVQKTATEVASNRDGITMRITATASGFTTRAVAEMAIISTSTRTARLCVTEVSATVYSYSQ